MMTRQPTWRHPLWVLLTLSALTLGFAACDDSGGSEVPNDMGDDLADAPGTDVVDPMTSMLIQVTPPPGEAQRMNFNGDTTVGVRFVTSDMTGIANQTLTFDIESSTNDCHLAATPCVRLAARTTVTNETGLGEMIVNSDVEATDVTIRVGVENQDTIDPVFPVVQIRDKDAADVIVHFEYDGIRQFAEVKPFLFSAADYDCSTVYTAPLRDEGMLPTAERNTSPSAVTAGQIEDAVFINLPTAQDYIAVGLAETDAGLVTVYGCSDMYSADTPGSDRELTVVLEEVPILVAGNYDITSNFDLTSALPRGERDAMGNFVDGRELGDWIDLVILLFQDPGQLLVQELLPIVENLGGISVPDGLEAVAAGIVNDLIESQAPDWVNNALTVGGDVSDLLTNLQLEGELIIVDEPDADGQINGDNDEHNYAALSFAWRLPCVQAGMDPSECGKSTVSFQQLGRPDLAISANWTGTVVPCEGANGECLQINLHGLTVPYGEIALAIIEGWVLPEFFGPSVDSLDAFIDNVLLNWLLDFYSNSETGMQQPLTETGCAGVGQALGNWTDFGSIVETIGEFGCNEGKDALIDLVRGEAADLTLDTQDNLLLETAEPCRMLDSDGDLRYDMIGDGGIESARCNWNIRFQWNDNDPVDITGKFHAVRGN